MAFKSLRDKKTHQSIRKLVRIIIFLCLVIVFLVISLSFSQITHPLTSKVLMTFLFRLVDCSCLGFDSVSWVRIFWCSRRQVSRWLCVGSIMFYIFLFLSGSFSVTLHHDVSFWQVGHMAPDTDSYCTAMAAAELFRFSQKREWMKWETQWEIEA